MTFKNRPYLIAIDDREVNIRDWHAVIAEKLTNGGFDVGPMFWTAEPELYSKEEIKAFWIEAQDRAGIAQIEMGRDTKRQRTWFKVWKKETA
jgi:hypothetical protein